MSGPPDLSPREAVERWLDKQRVDKTDQTVSSYWYRLKLFVEWCERQQIDDLRAISGWDLDTFEAHRRSEEITSVSLANELKTLRQFFRWASRVGLVDASVPESIQPPTIRAVEEVSIERLDGDLAADLLASFRDGLHRLSLGHVFLELAWWTSARMGAIRGLDVQDFDAESGTVSFRHREHTGLKKGLDGERLVGLPDGSGAAEIVAAYIADERADVVDEVQRRPLLTTRSGRPSPTTLREWSYWATVPCRGRSCPHGKSRASCAWFSRTRARECPSSLSPHAIRTGSITWQLSKGVPIEVVAKRANSSPETIRRHYYPAVERERDLDQRRQEHLDKLDFDT